MFPLCPPGSPVRADDRPLTSHCSSGRAEDILRAAWTRCSRFGRWLLRLRRFGPLSTQSSLLLHGLNDSHRTWREIWPRLPGRRVLMLDLPGHGMSSRPDAPYTLDWNATQVARFIERLDLRTLDVVGHSYGGGVAQWLLLKCRARIRRLALLSSGGLGREVYPWLRIASVPFLIEAFGQRWMGPIAGFAMAQATTSDARAEIALLASYLAQPGSARAFSRTVRDVIGWRGQTRNLFDQITEVDA